MSVFIIAEAGVNHNGDIKIAKKLVDAAKYSGADCVKFQSFTAQNLVTKKARKALYQVENTNSSGNQYDMLKNLELTREQHFEISEHCKNVGIQFLSTAFDVDGLSFLLELGIEIIKIPSGEITNLPYLRYIGEKNSEIIMSTGMANMSEIDDAINVLESSGTERGKITILQCTTEYPAPFENVNLRAMRSIGDKFGVKVGYSDHTLGIEVSIAAVALGATIIEKHFTLDRTQSGPDHKASLEPNELTNLVHSIRNIEKSLGSNEKNPSKGELENRLVARKSLVAKRAIDIGEIFSENNLTTKRPGSGVSPMKWDSFIGKPSSKNYSEDDLIAE